MNTPMITALAIEDTLSISLGTYLSSNDFPLTFSPNSNTALPLAIPPAKNPTSAILFSSIL